MERNIPHVIDIFTQSPGEKRRALAKEREAHKAFVKEDHTNQENDSAVSLGSSDEEDEDRRNISKYFEYLNEVDEEKKNKKATKSSKKKNSRAEKEDEIKHIERHLSLKKTIRKKMMRDLQQAFVENPREFQEDPQKISPEKKSNINIQNLTISKKRLSKSEHSFLDMLKDEKNEKVKKKIQQTSDEDSGLDSPTRQAFRSKSKQDLIDSKKKPEKEKLSFWKRLSAKAKLKNKS